VTEWLGGELVDRLGIGVHEGADVNAPNSLTGPAPRKPAAGTSLPTGWPELSNLPGASS
jgi:hypothetical protein